MIIINIPLYLSTAIYKSNHDRSYELKSLGRFVSTTKPVKEVHIVVLYRHQTKRHCSVPNESRH